MEVGGPLMMGFHPESCHPERNLTMFVENPLDDGVQCLDLEHHIWQ